MADMKWLAVLLALACGVSSAQTVYNQFSPGGDLAGSGSTWNNQVIAPGAVTLAKQANLLASSVECNTSGSPATPQACNPLGIQNLMNAQIGALSAVTLSGTTPAFGTYTNDTSVTLAEGNTVMVYGAAAGQTCGPGTTSAGTGGSFSLSVCEGLWTVHAAAAWTRPPNYPHGYVIPQNCIVLIQISAGAKFQGHVFALTGLLSGSVTIDTTNPAAIDHSLGPATTASNGSVWGSQLASLSNPAAIVSTSPASAGGAAGDCVSFSNTAGSVADQGNLQAGLVGPCAIDDSNGNISAAQNGTGTAPTVTGTGCSLGAGSASNNSGSIVASGVDTCTLVFDTGFISAPFCAVGNVGATVLASLTALPTTAHAIFATAAAGTFNYICL